MIAEETFAFFAGLLVGVFLGLFVAAVCVAASRRDRNNG